MAPPTATPNAGKRRHEGGVTGAELVAQASQAVNTYAANYADPAMISQSGSYGALAADDTPTPYLHAAPDYGSVQAGEMPLVPSISTALAGTGPTVDMSYGISVPAIPRGIGMPGAPWVPPAAGGGSASPTPSSARAAYPAASGALTAGLIGVAAVGAQVMTDEDVRANVAQAKGAAYARARQAKGAAYAQAQQVKGAVEAVAEQVRAAAGRQVEEAQLSVTARVDNLRTTALLYALVGTACVIIASATISLTLMHLYNGRKRVAAASVVAGTLLSASMSTIGRAVLGV